jgi:spermidine/putrescine transport system permease protein
VRIYSTGRTAPTPALNALATLTLGLTLVIAIVGILLWRAARAARGGTGSAMQEFATLDAETPR